MYSSTLSLIRASINLSIHSFIYPSCQVAVKFEKESSRCPQLRHEYKVYRELVNCHGFCCVSPSSLCYSMLFHSISALLPRLPLSFTDLNLSLFLCLRLCVFDRFIISERRTATMWWWWTSWGPLSKTCSTSALGSSHWKQVTDWLLSYLLHATQGWGGDILSPALLCHTWCSAMQRIYVWCRSMFVLYTITSMTVL